jgi:CRISPR-associated protein Cas6
MYWQEDKMQAFKVTDEVIDLLFNIDGSTLPVDHAHALAAVLKLAAPMLAADARIGIHSIHVAGSQNGWDRPNPQLGQVLQLSKRTKLTIRTPKEFAAPLQAELAGQTLDILGHRLTLGTAKSRLLSSHTTLFARSIVLADGEAKNEEQFLQRIAGELAAMQITIRKALCGKLAALQIPDRAIPTRSLLLAELRPEESLRLQQYGLGSHRALGCGIFIPHKGIAAVNAADND